MFYISWKSIICSTLYFGELCQVCSLSSVIEMVYVLIYKVSDKMSVSCNLPGSDIGRMVRSVFAISHLVITLFYLVVSTLTNPVHWWGWQDRQKKWPLLLEKKKKWFLITSKVKVCRWNVSYLSNSQTRFQNIKELFW